MEAPRTPWQAKRDGVLSGLDRIEPDPADMQPESDTETVTKKAKKKAKKKA